MHNALQGNTHRFYIYEKLILLSALLIFYCSSDDDEPNCDCGIVEDYGWTYENGEELYLLDIRNGCTNQIYTIQVTYNIFSSYNSTGDRLCKISVIRLD